MLVIGVRHKPMKMAKNVEIVGVAGANMQWGRFVCPSSSQKRESTAFAYEFLGGFRVPVSKMVEVVLHVRKGAKFGVEKVNGGQNICHRVANVGNGKNFKKQAQSSKGY